MDIITRKKLSYVNGKCHCPIENVTKGVKWDKPHLVFVSWMLASMSESTVFVVFCLVLLLSCRIS